MESRIKVRTATGGGFKPTECRKRWKNEQKAVFYCDCATKFVLVGFECIAAYNQEMWLGWWNIRRKFGRYRSFPPIHLENGSTQSYFDTHPTKHLWMCGLIQSNELHHQTNLFPPYFRARCDSPSDCLFFWRRIKNLLNHIDFNLHLPRRFCLFFFIFHSLRSILLCRVAWFTKENHSLKSKSFDNAWSRCLITDQSGAFEEGAHSRALFLSSRDNLTSPRQLTSQWLMEDAFPSLWKLEWLENFAVGSFGAPMVGIRGVYGGC